MLLAGLGVDRRGGEPRPGGGRPRPPRRAAAGATPRWHFIGQLQRNKCRSVVRYADVVQSVDSVRLATALAGPPTADRDRPLDVLVQVSIDGDPARGGALPDAADPDQGLGRGGRRGGRARRRCGWPA